MDFRSKTGSLANITKSVSAGFKPTTVTRSNRSKGFGIYDSEMDSLDFLEYLGRLLHWLRAPADRQGDALSSANHSRQWIT